MKKSLCSVIFVRSETAHPALQDANRSVYAFAGAVVLVNQVLGKFVELAFYGAR
jgi:hypothetical protein